MDCGVKTFILLTLSIFAVKTAYCGLLFKELPDVHLAEERGELNQEASDEHGTIDVKIQIFVPKSHMRSTEIVSATQNNTTQYPLLVPVKAVKNEPYCKNHSDDQSCISGPELSLLLYAVVNGVNTYNYSANLTSETLWLNLNLFAGFSVTPFPFHGLEVTTAVLNFDYNSADGVPNINIRHNASVAFVDFHIVTTPCKQPQQINGPSRRRQEKDDQTGKPDQVAILESGNVDVNILVLVPESQMANVEIVSSELEMAELYPLIVPVRTVINEMPCEGNSGNYPCMPPGPVLSLWLYVSVNGAEAFTYSVNITYAQVLLLNINVYGDIGVTPIFFNGAESTTVFLNFVYGSFNGFDISHPCNSSAASVYLQTTTTVCLPASPEPPTGSSNMYHGPLMEIILLILLQILLN